MKAAPNVRFKYLWLENFVQALGQLSREISLRV